MSLGQRIKYLRNQRGWSQGHLADICSLNTKTISRIECEKTLPSHESQLAIASAFDVDVYQLNYSSKGLSALSNQQQYILEFYFNQKCIEFRHSNKPFLTPNHGEEIYVEFKDSSYNQNHGFWWIVIQRRFMYFSEETNVQTIQLYCEPRNDH